MRFGGTIEFINRNFSSENCPGASVKFDGKEGIFIEGEVSPPLADVFVTITTESNEYQVGQVIDVKTAVNGKYR